MATKKKREKKQSVATEGQANRWRGARKRDTKTLIFTIIVITVGILVLAVAYTVTFLYLFHPN